MLHKEAPPGTARRVAGERSVALRLLAQFEAQFPGDARTPEVRTLSNEIAR